METALRIIMVEASSGLSRDEAIRIGKMSKAGEIDDVEKNEFVLTGRDSLHQTFKRAASVFENDWTFIKNHHYRHETLLLIQEAAELI